MLLELMLIDYYFAYVVIYNCTSMFVSVSNMLLYIMYQSFKTMSGYVLIKKMYIYLINKELHINKYMAKTKTTIHMH